MPFRMKKRSAGEPSAAPDLFNRSPQKTSLGCVNTEKLPNALIGATTLGSGPAHVKAAGRPRRPRAPAAEMASPRGRPRSRIPASIWDPKLQPQAQFSVPILRPDSVPKIGTEKRRRLIRITWMSNFGSNFGAEKWTQNWYRKLVHLALEIGTCETNCRVHF